MTRTSPAQQSEESCRPTSVGLADLLWVMNHELGPAYKIDEVRLEYTSQDPDNVGFNGDWSPGGSGASADPNQVPVVHFYGAAQRGSGRIVSITVNDSPVGDVFTEERLARLRDFWNAEFSIMSPDLSADERLKLLRALKLVDLSPSEMKEYFRDHADAVQSVDGTEYRVSTSGSEEGISLFLEATACPTLRG